MADTSTTPDAWFTLWSMVLPVEARLMLEQGMSLPYVRELFPFDDARYDVQYRLLDLICDIFDNEQAWAKLEKLYFHAYSLSGLAPWDLIESLEKFGISETVVPLLGETIILDALHTAPQRGTYIPHVEQVDTVAVQHLLLCLTGWLVFATGYMRADPRNKVFEDYGARFVAILAVAQSF